MNNSLAYYLFFLKQNNVSKKECLDHADDYRDYLKPYEEITINRSKTFYNFDCLPLAQLEDDSNRYEDFAEQIYEGNPPNMVSSPWPPPLPPGKSNKDFFNRYIAGLNEQPNRQTETSVNEINQRIEEILEKRTAGQQRLSGLVVGRVQSGKTRNYVGLMLKAVEYGWDVIFILTSCSTALGIQTFSRIEKDFGDVGVTNGITLNNVIQYPKQVLEICKLAQSARNIGHNFYWGVALKQKNHLDNIIKWLEDNNAYVSKMKILIIDDEADNASPEATASKELWDEDVIDAKIEEIRKAEESRNEQSTVANWFDSICEETFTEDQCCHIEELLKKGSAQVCLNNLFCDHYARELLNLEEVEDAIRQQFKQPGRGKKISEKIDSPNCFVQLLKSILSLSSGRSIINDKIRTIIDRSSDYTAEYKFAFARCAYIGYTATPYACLLNRPADATPLYPDFVYSLPKADEYFGLEEIFGTDMSTDLPRMGIITSLDQEKAIAERAFDMFFDPPASGSSDYAYVNPHTLEYKIHNSSAADGSDKIIQGEWSTLKEAIAWAFCTAASRRYYHQEYKRNDGRRGLTWTTMMVNLSAAKDAHQNLQELLSRYIEFRCSESEREKFLQECKDVWQKKTASFTSKDFTDALDRIPTPYELWDNFEEDLRYFILEKGHYEIIQINSTPEGHCGQERYEDGGDTEDRKAARKEHDKLWIICGGNAISRGLTLEGLTVSYFLRLTRSTAVDTFTQMGRWFGYRPKYELLSRLYMESEAVKEYKNTAIEENHMHAKWRQAFDSGLSPADAENFMTFLLWGNRKLSGKAFAMKVLTNNIGAAFSTSDVSFASENITGVTETIAKFLSPKAKYDNSGAFYPQFPVWKDISSQEMIVFLKELKKFYPEASERTLRSLIHELEVEDSLTWDIVIGSEYNSEKSAATPYRLWADFYVGSGNPKGQSKESLQLVSYNSARSISAFYGMIDRCIVNKTDASLLIQCKEAIVSNIQERYKDKLPVELDNILPSGKNLQERIEKYGEALENSGADMHKSVHYMLHGNSALEGYRNRSSHEYQCRVYKKAKQNPVLQIYPIRFRENVIFTISFFWPEHCPKGFREGGSSSSDSTPASEAEMKVAINAVLKNYDFFMTRQKLVDGVKKKLGDKFREPIFSQVLATCANWGKRDSEYTYYHHDWAADNAVAEEKFSQTVQAEAFDILRTSGECIPREDLIQRIVKNLPIVNPFLDSYKQAHRDFFSNIILTEEFMAAHNIKLTRPGRKIHYAWQPDMEG